MTILTPVTSTAPGAVKVTRDDLADTRVCGETIGSNPQISSFQEILSTGDLKAELAATIQENLFSDLKAPVVRIGAAFIPPPHSGPLVEAMVPGVERIETETLRLLSK